MKQTINILIMNHRNIYSLTFAEVRVIDLSSLDYSCAEIATQLNVTEETIRKHRKNVIAKLEITDGKRGFLRFLRYWVAVKPLSTPSLP